jgi:uracil-DNA glycosylase
LAKKTLTTTFALWIFDPVFLGQCRHFFSKQVELIKPKAVLFLGKLSPFVLGEERLAELGWLAFVNRKRGCISKFRSLDRSGKSFVPRSVWKGVRNEVGIALLLHPSNRGRNLPNRELKYPDADPEIPFLDDVLRTTHPDISLD